MVRVKSEAYTKASVKAPRKQTALRSDSAKTPKNGKSSNRNSGGNPYCRRLTPTWQKPITTFFSKNESQDEAENENISKNDFAACSSAASSEPLPGCSKDDSGINESLEESENATDEESSLPDPCTSEKTSADKDCGASGSGECESNGSNK